MAPFCSRLRLGSAIVTTKPSAAVLMAACALARASLCHSTNVRFCIECLHHFARLDSERDRAGGCDFVEHATGADLVHAAARDGFTQAVAHLQRREFGGKDYLPNGAPAGARQMKPDFAGGVH